MKSMTGYGRKQHVDSAWETVVEVYSVNKKNLEIQTSLPKDWQGLERHLINLVQKAIQRGKVHLSIQVRPVQASTHLTSWDPSLIQKTLEEVQALANSFNIQGPLTISDLLKTIKIAHLQRSQQILPTWEQQQPRIIQLTTEALQDLDAMRVTEGEALKQAMLQK